jgi:foldase protein PrsA
MKSALNLVFGAAVALGFAQVDPNRVVATVNGDEIKGAEYYRRMEFLPGVLRKFGNIEAMYPPGFLTLEQLITERLVLQLAKEKGVFPTAPEIDQEIRFRMEAFPRLLEDLAERGRTEADLRQDVLLDLAQFKLQTFGVNVTDQDVENVYKSRPQDFTTPKRFKLRVIVVKTEADAAKVDEALKTKPFAQVARELSAEVSRFVDGEFGTLPVNAIPGPVREALEIIRVGQTTEWLMGEQQRSKFLLEEVIPEQLQPLTPALRREIRRREMLQRGSVRNNVQAEMRQIRSRARIDIREKVFADAYKDFIEKYLTGGG